MGRADHPVRGRRGKRSPKSAEPEKKGFETEAASSESGSRSTRGRTGTCSGPKRGDQTSNSSRVEDRPQSPSTSPGGEAASPDSASQPLSFATYAGSHRRNSDVDKTRSLLREDRRLVVNAIKLAAYNSERRRFLALRFNDYYGRRKDTFSVFRALLQLPGDVQRLSQNHIKVELQRPDSNKVATALEALTHELNQEKACLLGDGPILSFALASSPVNMNSLDSACRRPSNKGGVLNLTPASGSPHPTFGVFVRVASARLSL